MSARPDVPRLAEEDLDLLISRSLDGDLSPEEEQQLERLIALDPAAARRKAELAALVAEVKALPEPAAPFAISTRVNSNVAERAGRPGSLAGRVGFFPAPGSGKVALVALFIVGVAIAVLRPAPKRLVEGPVDVLLYNPPPAASAPARAPESVVAQSAPEPKRQADREEQGRLNEADERAKGLSNEMRAEVVDKLAKTETGAKKEDSAKRRAEAEPAIVAGAAGERGVADAPKQKAASSGGRADLDAGAFAQAPGKVTSTGSLAAAPAPPPAEAAGPGIAASRAVSAPHAMRGWTVSVRGDAARRWALRRAPDRYPEPASLQPAVFRVAVDAAGRVVSVRPVGVATAEPGLDAFVRGMVFEALPPPAGAARDQKDAPAAPAALEFEIELAPR